MTLRTSEVSYRSRFEEAFGDALDARGIPYRYEKTKIKYLVEHVYTPDWELASGVLVETKGWLRPKDRSVLAAVKRQHPHLDIRVLFQNWSDAHRPINKGSATSNGEWLTAHGIPWTAEALPMEWTLDEGTNRKSSKLPPPSSVAEIADRWLLDPRSWGGDDIPIKVARKRTTH